MAEKPYKGSVLINKQVQESLERKIETYNAMRGIQDKLEEYLCAVKEKIDEVLFDLIVSNTTLKTVSKYNMLQIATELENLGIKLIRTQYECFDGVTRVSYKLIKKDTKELIDYRDINIRMKIDYGEELDG